MENGILSYQNSGDEYDGRTRRIEQPTQLKTSNNFVFTMMAFSFFATFFFFMSRSTAPNFDLASTELAELSDGSLLYEDLSESTKVKLFEDFITNFKRNYTTDAEKGLRFANFKSFLHLIDERNAVEDGEIGAVHGITKFADLTQEEFMQTYLGYDGSIKHPETPHSDTDVVVASVVTSPTPTSFSSSAPLFQVSLQDEELTTHPTPSSLTHHPTEVSVVRSICF